MKFICKICGSEVDMEFESSSSIPKIVCYCGGRMDRVYGVHELLKETERENTTTLTATNGQDKQEFQKDR